MMQSGRTDPMYTDTMDCFRKIYKSEGLKGFYKGSLITVLGASGAAIYLVAYDRI